LIFGLVFLISGCNKDEVSMEPINEEMPLVKKAATYHVNLVKGIRYADALSHDDWNSSSAKVLSLKLDAYIPENSLVNRPTFVLIHGGGLDIGTRTNANIVNMAHYFASRGWVVFSLDYRLKSAKGSVPAAWKRYTSNEDALKIYPANRDVKAAIRWLYANAETYHINTDFISVGGGSAGAFLSVSLGAAEAEDYTKELSIIEDPSLATTNLNQPARVHTIIDFWGGDSYIKTLERVYGMQRFDSNDAPILIVHGTNDTVVQFNAAETLKSTYETTGVSYQFYPLQGLGHGPWNAVVNGKSLADLAFDFICLEQKLTIE